MLSLDNKVKTAMTTRPFYSDSEWPSSDRFAALDHYAEEHCAFLRLEDRDPPPATTETEPKEETP
jgi:hypothetical protein